MRLVAITLCILLSVQGFPLAQAAGKAKPSPASEPAADAPKRPRKPGLADPAASDKGARLKELIKILQSITDDDYDAAVSSVPKPEAEAKPTASRTEAIKTAYDTLAAMEYHDAATADPKDAPKYSEAYHRVGGPTETGWAMDLLEWLGNAAINYALVGGTTYVGRGIDNSKVKGLEKDLAHADADKKGDVHYQLGSAYEELAAAAVAPPPLEAREAQKEARLKRLADLLNSMSDEDYRKALAQLSRDQAKAPAVASREAALRSVYTSLEALEYHAAGESHAKDLDGVLAKNPEAVAVDPATLNETGWAVDLLKWLGNAAINYALNGGETYVGRKLKDSKADKLEETLAGLENDLAAADSAEKKAEVRYKMGTVYESLAALSVAPETDDERAARKKARLADLAELLQAVTDDEYKEALKQARGNAGSSALASREAVLKSAYVTLAALEYRSAGDRYAGDLKRVAEADAKDVVVDPATLQETGWAQDLLGLVTLGGVGYLIYQNERGHGRHHSDGQGWQARAPAAEPAPGPRPTPRPDPLPPQKPCPDFTVRSADGYCVRQGGPAPNPLNPTPGCDPATQDCRVYQRSPQPLPTPVPAPSPFRGVVACPESYPGGGNGPCVGRGMPHPIFRRPVPSYSNPAVAALYQTRAGLEIELSGADAAPEKSAELHHKLGAVYEQLASAAAPKAEPAAPEPAKPQTGPSSTRIAPPETRPQPRPEAKAERKEKTIESPQPTKEDLMRKDMKEMDDLEKEMKQKINAPRPQ
ncbi:MAG: hypothetical protein HY077_17055 [Elusimicrobia bacterium]|nr:hypothetical protein [Elusimicrobiota bacterium]